MIFAANWKMYLNESDSNEFVKQMHLEKENFVDKDIMIFPSFSSIRSVKNNTLFLPKIVIGMQDCSHELTGALTGDNSINAIEVDACIVGHSERRKIFNESNEIIKRKLDNALNNVASTILCIGETKEEKDKNETFNTLENQLSILPKELHKSQLIIAYEPVWSIGTGLVPSNEYISEVLSYIKRYLNELYSDEICDKILLFYGGSVDENNIKELSKIGNINGFLVGSASCKFEKFKKMINAI